MRSDPPEPAADALERLTGITRVCGTDWALGVEAGACALLSAGRAAEDLYREATGATVRKRTVETRDDRTAQERQIARLGRDGLSNPEIGARLFLSPRTVGWHPRKVFTELDIRSRHELAGALPRSEPEFATA